MYGTPLYRVWAAMISRCENPKVERYPRYGGRGIKVCKRWHSFANFYADMAPRPPGLSIDRIDNDGDYAPGNCRWATRQEQWENSHAGTQVKGGRVQGRIAPTSSITKIKYP
jgi:hypothetical protein